MAQAIERLLATPTTSPNLPEKSVIGRWDLAASFRPTPAAAGAPTVTLGGVRRRAARPEHRRTIPLTLTVTTRLPVAPLRPNVSCRIGTGPGPDLALA